MLPYFRGRREISCIARLRGPGLAICRKAELGQEHRSTLINQSLSSPASKAFRIMTWSLQRDDNTLAAIEREDTRIDCERVVLLLDLDTVHIPGPGPHGESAATLECAASGTFGHDGAVSRFIIERFDQCLDGGVVAPALKPQCPLPHRRKETRWLQPLSNVTLEPQPLQASRKRERLHQAVLAVRTQVASRYCL